MDFSTILEQLKTDTALPFAIPIFLFAMGVEWYIGKKEQPDFYKQKDLLVSLSMGVFSSIVEFLPKV